AVASPANRFWTDVREGLTFIWATPFVRGIVLVNVCWALGGGMNNLVFDRIARHEFASGGADRGDWSMAILMTAAGAGLFVGMAVGQSRIIVAAGIVADAISCAGLRGARKLQRELA